MGCFGIKLDDNKLTNAFIKSIDENMKRIKNGVVPIFDSVELKTYKLPGYKILLVINMEVYFYNFSNIGWLFALFTYLMWGFGGWSVVGILIGLTGLFWWDYFYFVLFRWSIKKQKVITDTKYITRQELLKYVVFNK